MMRHAGDRRLCDLLSQHYHHPKLDYHIYRLKYKDFQRQKLTSHEYGLLPKREVLIAPWEEVPINLMQALSKYGR